MKDQIKTFPELTRLAHKAKCWNPLRIWYYLRSLTNDGKVELEAVNPKDINLGWRHFKDLLKAGDGIFWCLVPENSSYTRGRIYLAGVKTLAENFGCTNFTPVEIPFEALRSKALFMAFSLNGWITIKKRGQCIISLQSLCDEWGIRSPTTIKNWIKKAGIGKIPNVAQEPIANWLEWEPESGETYFWVERRSNGELFKCSPLPNTYVGTLKKGKKTTWLRRAEQKGRKASSPEELPPVYYGGGGQRSSRRYYTDEVKAHKAARGARERIFVDTRTQVKSARYWEVIKPELEMEEILEEWEAPIREFLTEVWRLEVNSE